MSKFPDFSEHGYQLEKELGTNYAGGRVTYLANCLSTNALVVIKQFQFARSGSTWADYDAYDREIQILRGLDHPGIPRYLDSFQTSSGFCMVQEYKPAQSLAVPRSFKPDDIRHIAISILKILNYLQNRVPPLIHRDIKPENILVDEQMNVYLVDFGFAHVGEGRVSVSSVVKGTLGFMPPEQMFNRELTEASDLYGLGMTLICLLTGTKSVDIGNLVDISYRVSFKHLIPKLNSHWVKWLEKMVEPRLKDRFPNATAALDGMPACSVRLPEVRLNRASVELTATRLGETLSQTIAIENVVPETMLEGQWEVAPHTSDPPRLAGNHPWISFEPATFTGNQSQCQIRVDTGKLMADKVYNRKLLLRTNAQVETYSLPLQIRTAPIAVRVKRPPYGTLALLLMFAVAVSWASSWLVMVVGAIANSPSSAAFGTLVGMVVGLEVVAWMLAIAGATVGASSGVIAGAISGLMALGIIWSGGFVPDRTAVLLGTGLGTVMGGMIGWALGTTAEQLILRRLNRGWAVATVLFIIAAGISIGLGLTVGLAYAWVIGSIIATGFPLMMLVAYLPLQTMKRVSIHRRSEQHLIKP